MGDWLNIRTTGEDRSSEEVVDSSDAADVLGADAREAFRSLAALEAPSELLSLFRRRCGGFSG